MTDYQFKHYRDRKVQIYQPDSASLDRLNQLFRFEGFKVIASKSTEHFLGALEGGYVDVAVVDMTSSVEGLGLLEKVRLNGLGTVVVMTTSRADVAGTVEAMKRGAAEVFMAPLNLENIISSVRFQLAREIRMTALDRGSRQADVQGFAHLTPRENEVLQLLIQGNSNKEVAKNLTISPRTIEVHRSKIMEKFNARNTADLMRIVLTS